MILFGPFLFIAGRALPEKYPVARIGLQAIGAAALLAAAFSRYSKGA